MTTTIATAHGCSGSGSDSKDRVRSQSRCRRRTATSTKSTETLNAEELAIVKQVRAFMETKVAPDHHQVLGGGCVSLRAAAGGQGAGHRRAWQCRATAARGGSLALLGFVAMEIARIDPSFATFFGVHRRPGDGLHLHRRIGRAEAEVAAADGALREDRLLRPDRAAGGFRRVRRPDDDGEARGRHLDPQWPEAVDRQRAVVRHLDHLGARRRRQPGQGLHRREQDHARLQRREDPEQDRAQGRPERPDHAEGRVGCRKRTASRAATRSATPRRC